MQEWITTLHQLQQDGIPAVLVTIAIAKGSTPRNVGAKMVVTTDGIQWGTVGGGQLEEIAIKESQRALQSGGQEQIMLEVPVGERAGQCCGGSVSLLLEVIGQGAPLIIFGGGHVGSAICQVLQGTPFNITLIDSRPDWPKKELLPATTTTISFNQRIEFYAQTDWKQTYVLVLTHSHQMDQDLLTELVDRPLKYLGMIGSATKWSRFQTRMRELGIDQAKLDQIHCPIGLPLGGKSPKEVAISVAAQLLTIHHDDPNSIDQ